jgi:chemotaxis signal transduction protein
VRELLARRAERLKQREDRGEEEATLWVAEFPLGEERFALPLEALRAALPLRMVTPVPLSAAGVVGVLRFQGQVIAALSLASLLGARGWRHDPAVLLVLERGGGELVALDCEQIPRPVALPVRDVEAARGRQSGVVLEVAAGEGRLVQLIDLERLLAQEKEARRGR